MLVPCFISEWHVYELLFCSLLRSFWRLFITTFVSGTVTACTHCETANIALYSIPPTRTCRTSAKWWACVGSRCARVWVAPLRSLKRGPGALRASLTCATAGGAWGTNASHANAALSMRPVSLIIECIVCSLFAFVLPPYTSSSTNHCRKKNFFLQKKKEILRGSARWHLSFSGGVGRFVAQKHATNTLDPMVRSVLASLAVLVASLAVRAQAGSAPKPLDVAGDYNGVTRQRCRCWGQDRPCDCARPDCEYVEQVH